MIERFCENLLEKLRESAEPYAQRLLSGSLKCYEEYKHAVGILMGIEQSIEVIKQYYSSVIDMKKLKEHKERDYGDESFKN